MIPGPGRAAVLAQFHERHPGMVQMKSLARRCVLARNHLPCVIVCEVQV